MACFTLLDNAMSAASWPTGDGLAAGTLAAAGATLGTGSLSARRSVGVGSPPQAARLAASVTAMAMLERWFMGPPRAMVPESAANFVPGPGFVAARRRTQANKRLSAAAG